VTTEPDFRRNIAKEFPFLIRTTSTYDSLHTYRSEMQVEDETLRHESVGYWRLRQPHVDAHAANNNKVPCAYYSTPLLLLTH
jgi:hypothetical protein